MSIEVEGTHMIKAICHVSETCSSRLGRCFPPWSTQEQPESRHLGNEHARAVLLDHASQVRRARFGKAQVVVRPQDRG